MPSVSDLLFLSFYPCAYVGLALMAKRHLKDFHASLWVDALIGALAVSAVASAVLYDLVSVGIAGDVASVVTTLAYPVGDVLLLALVTGLFALTGWRPGRTWALIGISLALSAFGDVTYLYLTATGGYEAGTLLDSVWPASMLLLGAAAWRPQPLNRARLEGPLILAMPAFFSCTAMGLLILGQVEPLNPLALGLACGTLVALILRMAVTLSENLRMVAASRSEALTDALTGLGNRRKLLADLDERLAHARAEAPRVLILFDLDGFKSYNDSFGHPAGDALLARLGVKLAARRRTARGRLPARRRRVLRPARARPRRARGAARGVCVRADRDRRRRRRACVLRRGLRAPGGDRRARRPPDRRPAHVRAQGGLRSARPPGNGCPDVRPAPHGAAARGRTGPEGTLCRSYVREVADQLRDALDHHGMRT